VVTEIAALHLTTDTQNAWFKAKDLTEARFTDMNQDLQQNIELRIRSIRIIWLAMVLSIGAYYVFTILVPRAVNNEPNNTLFLVFVGIALAAVLISFPIKTRLLSRAVDLQQTGLVQQGYTVAWAITEVGALLGLLDYFLTGNRYYYVLFIIAFCGQLLHFPKREHVMNACFKGSPF